MPLPLCWNIKNVEEYINFYVSEENIDALGEELVLKRSITKITCILMFFF
jgi:hypothetical protein